MSCASGLETRRLDALTREEALDRVTVDAQHTADAHRIQTAVVNQTPNRFRMDAELVRYFTNADECIGLSTCGHARPTYLSERRIAAFSS
jgi:hypothetical protein